MDILIIIAIVWFSIGLVMAAAVCITGLFASSVYNLGMVSDVIKLTIISFFIGPILLLFVIFKKTN